MSGHVRVTAVSARDATNLQPALRLKEIREVVILCVSVCECIWISRCGVWSGVSGRCVWRCAAQLERETVYFLTCKFPLKSLFRTSLSATTPSLACWAIITGEKKNTCRHRNKKNKSRCGHSESTYLVFICSYTMSDNQPPPWGALACIIHPTCNQVRQWLCEIALPPLSWVWWETGLILW